MSFKMIFYATNIVLFVALCFLALMIDWKHEQNPTSSQELFVQESRLNDGELRNSMEKLMVEESGLEKEFQAVSDELQLLKKILADTKLREEADTQSLTYKTKTIKNQNHTIRVKLPTYSDATELILLVSSIGRGGSSWVGELLSKMSPETMYIFEPLKMIPDFYKTRFSPELEVEILSRIYSCSFTDEMTHFAKTWVTMFKSIRENCPERNCTTPSEVNARCRKAKTIIIKSIRIPLADTEVLLNKPSFQHLKVIYLARDPRAQILSRRDVFRIKKNDYTNECAKVEADVYAFRKLSTIFPGHFYFLRYEDLCQNPTEEASQLWKFLRLDGNATVPNSWRDFLASHDISSSNSPKSKLKFNSYSTYRNSTAQWYKWREDKNITMQSLENIEYLCSDAMSRLGYIPLRSTENVKNFSLPFLKGYSCDFWNCWTHRF